MNHTKHFFSIQQLERSADIYIFGDIVSWELFPGDVSANGIVEQIKCLDVEEIRVHIDSYGGSVSEGWAIYNALRQHPAKVITYGDGFVASAALYPFLAGDERVASNLSAYYFHRVSISTEGYSDALRKAADEADQMTEIGISAFVDRTGMTADEVRQLMEAETWLTPAQALEWGLATLIAADDAPNVAQTAKKNVIERIFLPGGGKQANIDLSDRNAQNAKKKPQEQTLLEIIRAMI